MKPHIIIVLAQGIGDRFVPHWQQAVDDKSASFTQLSPAIAALLARHDIPVFTTREYAPAAPSGAWSREEVAAGLDRVFRLVLREDRTIPEALIAELKLAPEVVEARPGLITAAPLPQIKSASRGARYDQPHRAIGLPDAQGLTRGDKDVVIAVLDTGIDLAHPEFSGRIAKPMDFVDILNGAGEFVGDYLGADTEPADDVGHGTHVASIAAGAGKQMASGVAPLCTIMPVRVLGAMESNKGRVGAGLIDNINNGVKYAVDQGAHIINMSLGVEHAEGGLPHEQVIRYAESRGVLIVAAAGNDGRESLYYPGALPGVVAVGSTALDGSVSPFSTFGSHVALTAPGEEIYAAMPGSRYGLATGTSHAAPFVTGTAALIQSLARRLGGLCRPRDVRRLLRNSSDRVGRSLRDRKAGFGRLNCRDALRLAQLELA
jgi:thermitase